MLGSVARELLAFLDIPIFAIGPNVGSQASYCNPRKMLCPVSFSNERRTTVEFALKLAEAHQSELMLMHVHEPGAEDVEPERMRRLTEEAGLVFSVSTHTHIAHGNVVEEILNTARLFGADWLILGTSPIAATPMSYTTFSATNKAYKLMAAASIPVLTLPHRTHSMNLGNSEDNAAVANTHA
jgi:nucleotide-binding universal stress UspA family protein